MMHVWHIEYDHENIVCANDEALDKFFRNEGAGVVGKRYDNLKNILTIQLENGRIFYGQKVEFYN